MSNEYSNQVSSNGFKEQNWNIKVHAQQWWGQTQSHDNTLPLTIWVRWDNKRLPATVTVYVGFR
jgi:hypothetical protein